MNAAKARAKAAAANAAKARANAVKVKANADKAVARAKANADSVVAKARANANRAKANATKAIADARAKANANAKTIEAKAYAAAKAKIATNTKSIQKAYDNAYASAKAEAKAKEYTNVEAYAAAKAKAAAERVSKIIASSDTVGQKLSLLERFVRSKAAKYGAGSAAAASAAASAASYMSPEVGKFMFRVITSMGLSAADSAAYVVRILKQVVDAKMIKIYRPKIEELMRQEAALRRKHMLASAWSTTRSVGGAAAEMAGRVGWYGALAAGGLVTEGGKYGAMAAGGIWNVITSVSISVPEKLKFVQIFFGQDVPKYIKDIIANVQREGTQFVGQRTDLAKIANFIRGAKDAYWSPLAKWIYEVYVAHRVGWAAAGGALKSFFGGTLPAFIREMARGKPSLLPPPPPPPQERSTIVRQIADRLKEALETAGKHGGRAWAGVTERGGQAWAGVKAGAKAGGNAWARSAKANPKLVEHILLGAGSLVGLGLLTYLITQTTKAVYSQQPPNDRSRRRSRRHRRR